MAAIVIRGIPDPTTEAVAGQLIAHTADHPSAEVEVYRQNEYSVRIRVTDPDFRSKSRSERHKTAWPILYDLSEEVLNELTMLLLITPDEKTTSMVRHEFDTGAYARESEQALTGSNAGEPAGDQ